MLDIWDEKLAVQGALVARERIAYIKTSRNIAQNFIQAYLRKRKIEISYKLSFGDEVTEDTSKLKAMLSDKLIKAQQSDIYQGYTGYGPHRDDLVVNIDSKNARNFASQGQQRSAVLAMKLAEASVLKAESGEQPVILLDDVLSELDYKRQDYLLNELSDKQVFITCCESEIMTKLKEGNKALLYKFRQGYTYRNRVI